MSTVNVPRANKKAAIERAYQILGEEASAKEIVEHLKNEGVSVSQMYAYTVLNNREQAPVSAKAIEIARMLVRETDSVRVANSAVRIAYEETADVSKMIQKYEKMIKVLEDKNSDDPEIKGQIDKLKEKINTVQKLAA